MQTPNRDPKRRMVYVYVHYEGARRLTLDRLIEQVAFKAVPTGYKSDSGMGPRYLGFRVKTYPQARRLAAKIESNATLRASDVKAEFWRLNPDMY